MHLNEEQEVELIKISNEIEGSGIIDDRNAKGLPITVPMDYLPEITKELLDKGVLSVCKARYLSEYSLLTTTSDGRQYIKDMSKDTDENKPQYGLWKTTLAAITEGAVSAFLNSSK